MAIVPGVSFGPIALGETLSELTQGGIVATNVSESHADVTLPGAPAVKLGVTLCAGKIIDIWVDDLRAISCVTYADKPIASSIAREDLEKVLGPCTDMPPRIGGTFEKCHDGGVYMGHGMGTFLQIRVRPKGFPFDDACAVASDDGSPVDLPERDRSHLLKKVLSLPQLSGYWHVTTPGRDPLRIVKTTLVPQESLMMFGSSVVWIDQSEAKKGSAFFLVTKLSATKTKAVIGFSYPIEGVVGTATFGRASSNEEWRLDTASVGER